MKPLSFTVVPATLNPSVDDAAPGAFASASAVGAVGPIGAVGCRSFGADATAVGAEVDVAGVAGWGAVAAVARAAFSSPRRSCTAASSAFNRVSSSTSRAVCACAMPGTSAVPANKAVKASRFVNAIRVIPVSALFH